MNHITYIAPQLPGHVSALGNLKLQAAIGIFLAIGGHLSFLRALATSFAVVPILGMPHFHPGIPAIADSAARITGTAILVGAQLSAPVILAIFLVDVSFGCIGKVASQIRINNDSNTAKGWLGLAVFFVAAAFLLDLLPGVFAAAIHAISQFTRSLA
jgi:flagellar biosynthesis protein FliR